MPLNYKTERTGKIHKLIFKNNDGEYLIIQSWEKEKINVIYRKLEPIHQFIILK